MSEIIIYAKSLRLDPPRAGMAVITLKAEGNWWVDAKLGGSTSDAENGWTHWIKSPKIPLEEMNESERMYAFIKTVALNRHSLEYDALTLGIQAMDLLIDLNTNTSPSLPSPENAPSEDDRKPS